MDAALRQHLGSAVTWQKPLGGYFFWLELPTSMDAGNLQAAAREAGTGFLQRARPVARPGA